MDFPFFFESFLLTQNSCSSFLRAILPLNHLTQKTPLRGPAAAQAMDGEEEEGGF